VLVCEAREVVGGAAVSEHPFGPDYTVTSLSYVVSLLPTSLVRALRLDRHGYHVYPQGPYFAPRRDGRYLRLPSDPTERHEEIAKFSGKDADAYPGWDADMSALGRLLGAAAAGHPAPAGIAPSRRPGAAGAAAAAPQGRRLPGRGRPRAAAVVLDRGPRRGPLRVDALRGLLSVSGVIGAWAGPRSAGTAYLTLHHHIGDLGDGQAGVWGFPRGGMGGVTQALAAAACSFGAEIRTQAPVARIDVRDARSRA
jgi:phytoene dehydrogenase-like protein